MGTKIFTVEEANRALPALRKLLVLLQERVRWLESNPPQLSLLVKEFKIPVESPVDPVYFARLQQVRKDLSEIEEIGCELKDLQKGIVDFPARINGKEIFLCWHLGERSVRHFHDPTEGYAGRRPLPRKLRGGKAAEGGGEEGEKH